MKVEMEHVIILAIILCILYSSRCACNRPRNVEGYETDAGGRKWGWGPISWGIEEISDLIG